MEYPRRQPENENVISCLTNLLNKLEKIHGARKQRCIACRYTTNALTTTGANVNTIERPALSTCSTDALKIVAATCWTYFAVGYGFY